MSELEKLTGEMDTNTVCEMDTILWCVSREEIRTDLINKVFWGVGRCWSSFVLAEYIRL